MKAAWGAGARVYNSSKVGPWYNISTPGIPKGPELQTKRKQEINPVLRLEQHRMMGKPEYTNISLRLHNCKFIFVWFCNQITMPIGYEILPEEFDYRSPKLFVSPGGYKKNCSFTLKEWSLESSSLKLFQVNLQGIWIHKQAHAHKCTHTQYTSK